MDQVIDTLFPSPDSCRYLYTIQPPLTYRCDPAISGQLSIGCAVSIGANEERVSIQWVLDPSFEDIPTSVLTNSDRFTILTMNHSDSVISTLTIKPLDDTNDKGRVYCQAVFPNGTVTSPSQKMSLVSLDAVGSCPSVLEDTIDRRCALQVGMKASPPPERCHYQYYTQPQLDCNPYNGNDYAVINTECDISFGPTQERVGVMWFFIPENSNTVTLLVDIPTKYSIVTSNFTYRIYSSLSVMNLQESDRGTYYCQIKFENGLLGEPSQSLTLRGQSAYEDQDSCTSYSQQVSEQRCALTTGMMPLSAGPTAVVEDSTDHLIIILCGVLGGLVVLLAVVVIVVSGFCIYKIRRATKIEYSMHSTPSKAVA